MDVRFWKYSQAPLVLPLQKSMKFEMYNDMYFQPSKVSDIQDRKYEPYNQMGSEEFKLHHNESKIPSMTQLFQESVNDLPLFKEKDVQ